MTIDLPVIPAGALILLAFFAPYAIGALNAVLPFVKTPIQRKLVAVVVSLVLATIVLAFYYWMTGDDLPSWPALVILSLLTASASWALVTKTSADKLEQKLTLKE